MSMPDRFREKGLIRPLRGRVFGGVCAGLGLRYGMPAWKARILLGI